MTTTEIAYRAARWIRAAQETALEPLHVELVEVHRGWWGYNLTDAAGIPRACGSGWGSREEAKERAEARARMLGRLAP